MDMLFVLQDEVEATDGGGTRATGRGRELRSVLPAVRGPRLRGVARVPRRTPGSGRPRGPLLPAGADPPEAAGLQAVPRHGGPLRPPPGPSPVLPSTEVPHTSALTSGF